MSDDRRPDDPPLRALEALADVEVAASIEAALRAAVEAGCAATASRRGLAGLFDGSAVTCEAWFDVDEGWTGAPLRWELGEGAPGRVCESGTPLACNELPDTADCLPETTGLLRLTRFACVPLSRANGEPLGFLEVGDRDTAYGADHVRALLAVARCAAHRLEALAADEGRAAERRSRAEALLGGRELFSLDPEAVLAEAAARARGLTGARDVFVLRLESSRQLQAEDLEDDERLAVEEAARTGRLASAGADILAAPLIGDDRLLGALVVRGVPADRRDERAEALAALAARVAVALEHALLYRTQADVAQRLQQRLLPLDPPRIPGLDVAVAYRSASPGAGRGGDFVEFYSQTESHLALAIGDVAGKGVEALATTVVVKYALRAAVRGGALSWPARPGVALQELHNSLLGELGGERFVTVLFALVGVRQGRLQIATAGHPGPFVVRADGVERPMLLTAPAIGIDLQASLGPYPSETLFLERGDCAVFFTDGIAELRDKHEGFFEDAMPAILAGLHDRPAAEVLHALLTSADAFAVQPAADDVAVVCARLTQMPAVKSPGQDADTVGKESEDVGGRREV